MNGNYTRAEVTEVLQKMEPKKPLEDLRCPTCKKMTIENCFVNFKHCFNCGQKIDWSEVEKE